MIELEDKIYLTVKEFAAAAKVSDKNIYQQVKTRLEPYTKAIDGVTMIDKAALEVFYSGIQSTQVKLNQVDLTLEQTREKEAENKYLTYLEEQVKELKQEIKDRDNTIKELQEQNKNLTNQIISMSNESLQQIASITKNIQLLQAAEVQGDIIKAQDQEPIEDNIVEPKKSLWDRIRGK